MIKTNNANKLEAEFESINEKDEWKEAFMVSLNIIECSVIIIIFIISYNRLPCEARL